ncbi:MAG: tetratricopeptide repeat protein [Pseudomonadota bacterium]
MKKAIHLNPISPVWYSYISGTILYRAGRYEEAIPKMKEALRVIGTHPVWFFRNLGGSYWRTGQYDEAIAAYKKALDIDPDYLPAHKGLAISYSLAGHGAEARTEVAEILRIDPKYSLETLQKESLVSLKNEADKERLIKALREAGLK